MASMLQSGLKIEPVITHHFGVDDYKNAFDLMASGQSGKVVMHWD
jgi:threonine 3-dehydrogenase